MDIFLHTPVTGWSVTVAHEATFLSITAACVERGHWLRPNVVPGQSVLPACRNDGVHNFLKSPADVMLMFDQDQQANGGDLVSLCEWAHKTGNIVGARYRQKTEEGKWNVLPQEGQGIQRVEWIATGCLVLPREALYRIVERCPELVYSAEDGRPRYGLFQMLVEDGRFWGEDMYFMKICKLLDEPVYCNYDVKVSHEGRRVWV